MATFISAVVLYTKFYDAIPNIFRTAAIIGLAAVAIYDDEMKLAVGILMMYFPFHLLLKEYSGSFNFAELLGLLNLNATFVIYWLEKWIDFTCILRSVPQDMDWSDLQHLATIRPQTVGYLPETLLFFSPYIILNISAVLFVFTMWIKKPSIPNNYNFISLLASLVVMLAIVFGSNYISPFSFHVLYFLLQE